MAPKSYPGGIDERIPWDAWEERFAACIETISQADDYGSQTAALRRITHLAAEAKDQLARERFTEEISR
jgi:hypothetical protein